MIALVAEMGRPGSASAFVKEVEAVFQPGGGLSKATEYEVRPQQLEMARLVAHALERKEGLIVEAGTGVGKSLAYLIPAILYAKRHNRRAVISTHTIALQEQLLRKDIPLATKALGVKCQAVLLKGRQNFLCGTRLERALAQSESLFVDGERAELVRLQQWSQSTRDGSLSDLNPAPSARVWEEVRSEPGICTPKTCGSHPRCFYQALRRQADQAELLVLNHALFFTLAAASREKEDAEGILFSDAFVVLDEAHTIEDVAASHLGLEISQAGVRRLLQRLYNPRTRKGLLQAAKQGEACASTASVLEEAEAYFQKLKESCKFDQGRTCRLHEPPPEGNGALAERLGRLADVVAAAGGAREEDVLRSELADAASRLRAMRAALLAFACMDDPSQVYWAELSGKKGDNCSLCAAPIDLSNALRQLLFRKGTTAILASATLAAGPHGMGYFQSRVGGHGVRACQIGSPFDYERQMKIHLVRSMPEPKAENYVEELAKWVAHFTNESQGHAFVLFTSYVTMRAVAARLESHFQEKNWPLLVQGQGMPPMRMVEEFRAKPHSVLFGVDSFWAGVDVPGDALTNVIITRLPFAAPEHPLIQARLEAIEKRGRRAFEEYSLPEAILKLRQGVGRLIRSKSDSGMIVILDSRVRNKPYGRAFLEALPKCPRVIH